MKSLIRFKLNGRRVSLETDDGRSLLHVLREDLALTGTKLGCGDGVCGSCTVVVEGKAVRSCQTALREVQGKTLTTVEGLARDGKLHPLQQAFIDHGALQCGYCTPGMLMNAFALLQSHQAPLSPAEIVSGMDDMLCRCGAHQRIVAAIEDASRRRGGAR